LSTQIQSHLGENIIETAEKLGVGSRDYNLINIDDDDSN
jgi:uncharacterized Fe-S center protein